jgi:hypothetical protein
MNAESCTPRAPGLSHGEAREPFPRFCGTLTLTIGKPSPQAAPDSMRLCSPMDTMYLS